mmetsp:Transcript_31224/g.58621  ORF Transcript_31224/g.58621 Transcript_31224/m.58621 type:complete len:84 (-) Transcript_31224:35-286(-)
MRTPGVLANSQGHRGRTRRGAAKQPGGLDVMWLSSCRGSMERAPLKPKPSALQRLSLWPARAPCYKRLKLLPKRLAPPHRSHG